MKRIFSVAVAIFAMQIVAFAQCPDGSITTVGFHPPADQLPPIERGVSYDETVQVNIPASFDTTITGLGTITITINNVHVDTINGEPTGITHTCSNNCNISGGGAGCINFTGTTNDPAQQYPLDVIVTATVTIPFLGQQTQHLHMSALGFSYYLTVVEAGVLSATAAASPVEICPGESSTLTASVTNGSGSETFSWSNGATTNPITVSPGVTTPYSVTVTDGGNTATASATVTVKAVPTATITPSSTMICSGASATVTASGGGTYSWNTGATTAAITVSPTSTTFYQVTVTNAGGCTATATDTVEVNPTPAPVADFDTTQTDNIVTFTNASTGATSYSWNFGDGSTGTDPNPTHTYEANGTFTVVLTAINTCGTDTYSEDVTIVGVLFISYIDNDLKFSVYPNPNEGIFTITLSDNSGKSNTISIYDLSGKNVFEETVNENGALDKRLDLSALPKGVYTLRLSSEKGNGVQKLVLR